MFFKGILLRTRSRQAADRRHTPAGRWVLDREKTVLGVRKQTAGGEQSDDFLHRENAELALDLS